jgi:hypothetical protein
MAKNTDAWLERARFLSKSAEKDVRGSEMVQFATSLLTALHGPKSTQVTAFLDGCAAISERSSSADAAAYYLFGHAQGAIRNAIAEIESGLVDGLRVLVTGEILSELLRTGKEVLESQNESSKNVGAVLIAAAYEDLLRRMASEFVGITDRPSLQDVVVALKDAGVLKGGEPGIAQSFLKFRNDSLHADWANVTRAQVDSCAAFIESML